MLIAGASEKGTLVDSLANGAIEGFRGKKLVAGLGTMFVRFARWGRTCFPKPSQQQEVTRKRRVLHLASLFILLAGCASTPQLSSEARAHLGAVRIDAAIDTPSQMYYFGQPSALGLAFFGTTGGVVGSAVDDVRGEDLDGFARNNGIHIDRIVREEAEEAFQQSGKLNLTDAPGGDVATLKISITMYGFTVPTGFSSELVPIVGIKCRLVDPGGKTVWSADQSTRPLGNPAAGKTLDEFTTDPTLIESLWRTAAKAVMADIVSHM